MGSRASSPQAQKIYAYCILRTVNLICIDSPSGLAVTYRPDLDRELVNFPRIIYLIFFLLTVDSIIYLLSFHLNSSFMILLFPSSFPIHNHSLTRRKDRARGTKSVHLSDRRIGSGPHGPHPESRLVDYSGTSISN